jgi:hypothetical protein
VLTDFVSDLIPPGLWSFILPSFKKANSPLVLAERNPQEATDKGFKVENVGKVRSISQEPPAFGSAFSSTHSLASLVSSLLSGFLSAYDCWIAEYYVEY